MRLFFAVCVVSCHSSVDQNWQPLKSQNSQADHADRVQWETISLSSAHNPSCIVPYLAKVAELVTGAPLYPPVLPAPSSRSDVGNVGQRTLLPNPSVFSPSLNRKARTKRESAERHSQARAVHPAAKGKNREDGTTDRDKFETDQFSVVDSATPSLNRLTGTSM